MLGGRHHSSQPKSSKKTVLPHQDQPPGVRQLQKMQDETLHAAGVTVQVSFGEPPEYFTAVVSRDPIRGLVQWSLYRGEGNSSQMEWQQTTSDTNWICNLISVAYPGISTTRKTLAETEKPDLVAAQAATTPMPVQTPPPEAPKVMEPAKAEIQSKFEGDLENMSLPTVIQSVEMNKLTGRLEIFSMNRQGEVYFLDGKPHHCIVGDESGEPAITELCSWDQGGFKFYKEEVRQKKTINKPVHFLLMAGAALQDQIVALKDKGVNLDSYLIKRHEKITKEEFDKLVQGGTGANEELQEKFYHLVDNVTPIVGILRQLPMPKADWVPIVFNLITCNLCSPAQATDARPNLAPIDWSEVMEVKELLSRPDTGIYTGAAYLYFLAAEFNRYARFKIPFSTLIIHLGIRGADNNIYPMDANSFRLIGDQLTRMGRATDMLFHFGELALAFISPATDLATAKRFANHLSEILSSLSFETPQGTFTIASAIGCASVPETCESVDALVRLAQPRI